jgi:hypothetical protein
MGDRCEALGGMGGMGGNGGTEICRPEGMFDGGGMPHPDAGHGTVDAGAD